MPTTAPPSLGVIAHDIDERLAILLDEHRQRWVMFDPDLAGPFDEISRMVRAGGKRLRPAFCYWGFVAAGGDPGDRRVIDAGAAFELMHAFALFHDDVMDDSASRRGLATTHAVYGDSHRANGWSGEARRFGEGVAILVGDLAFVLSDQLMVGAAPELWTLWNDLRIELNVGQYLDLLGSVQRDRRLHKAERIARYKSGKYTIERPLHVGACLAAPERAAELLPALSAYGLPLGDAFQMRDDVMGAFGDTALTGKPVGDDLREGKPTPLLARAVAAATPEQLQLLELVGTPGLDPATIAAIQQVIVDTGALAALEGHIETLADEAIAAIDAAPVTVDARRELATLADFVVGRNV
ncbi:MAG: polyprenyl synthetase family protein [Ilumatobacteraceae bacterium]